jgi:hypothetical protein
MINENLANCNLFGGAGCGGDDLHALQSAYIRYCQRGRLNHWNCVERKEETVSEKNKGRIQGFLFTIFLLFFGFWLFAESDLGQRTGGYLRYCRELIEREDQKYLRPYSDAKDANSERRDAERRRYARDDR